MSEWIKAFKGFNRDLSCTPDGGEKFQYEEGKKYETDDAKECECGFHACEYPLDVFSYYAPGTSVYHEVELGGKIDKGDNKIAATKIKVGASINIAGMVKAAIEYTNARVKERKESTGNCGASSNTGDYGASSNTGYRGASSNTGDYGASSNTGNCGASSNTGYCGIAEAGNPNSVAVAWGPECKAKGVRGSFLVLAEWISNGGNHWSEDTWTFAGSQMVRVDGETIKEDTLYWLHDGKVIEWKEEE